MFSVLFLRVSKGVLKPLKTGHFRSGVRKLFIYLAGIGLCKLDTSGYFLTLALLALGVAYMLVPMYLTWRRPAASLGRAAYSQHGGDRA